MRIISRRRLREFWEEHPGAERPLSDWYRIARSASWSRFAELRATFGSADQIKKFTVFNIGGNKYRLIAVIHFNTRRVYIRQILTHRAYDSGRWKAE